jgi:acetylornithine deacetylase/succinyl-diaminopimelate desuccinylase-like protein
VRSNLATMTPLTLADFERDALATLYDYARIPCLSPLYDEDWAEHGQLDQAVELLAQWARARRFASAEVVVHRLEGRTPMLVVTVEATAATSGTAVIYGHLDKQPPLGDWSEGLDPYTPVRRGDRVFARGVGDDGYAIFAALLALESMEAEAQPHSRCVVLIEACEESSSRDLDAYLDQLAAHLGDVRLMICLDSGALTYDRLWVTSSLRGVVVAKVTVEVLSRGVHSGSISGVAPSSFRILRQLLDRVEDARTGEILIEELRVPVPAEQAHAAKAIADEFGDLIAAEVPAIEGLELMGESAADRILRRTWYPALSVVGMGGIPQPSIAGNVLRPYTTAVLSLRLAPSTDSHRAGQLLTEALTTDVPSNARVTVSLDLGDGWVAPPLAPWLADALRVASQEAFGRSAGFTGEGGSIPFLASLAKRYPEVQFVATGVLGPDSNAHGIDEMLDLPMAVGVTNCVASLLGAFAEHATQA